MRRERGGARAGREPEAALEAAAATSGRAVLVSGLTVMVAMAGMFLAGDAVFTLVRRRHDPRRRRRDARLAHGPAGDARRGSATASSRAGSRSSASAPPRRGESRIWRWILDRVLRRPLVSAVLATALLVALALPALGMHTFMSGIDGLPQDIPSMQTYNRIETAFPGGREPPRSSSRPTTSPPAGRKAIRAAAKARPPAPQIDRHHDRRTARTDGRHRRHPDGRRRQRRDVRGGARRRCATTSSPRRSAALRRRGATSPATTAGIEDFNDQLKAHAADRVRVRPRRWRSCCCWSTFRSIVDPDQGDRAEPAVGRRRLRRARRSCSSTAGASAARLRGDRRRSTPGCRCSSS